MREAATLTDLIEKFDAKHEWLREFTLPVEERAAFEIAEDAKRNFAEHVRWR
jgi:hypothetical protein